VAPDLFRQGSLTPRFVGTKVSRGVMTGGPGLPGKASASSCSSSGQVVRHHSALGVMFNFGARLSASRAVARPAVSDHDDHQGVQGRCTKAGCPGRIPHDLRRTTVRNLVRAGVPERVTMQMTWHKTRSVFERYNIVSECDLVEAAKKLNVLQPAALPAEAGSHPSDHDGPASPKRRSSEGGHNSGTVEPDRGPRLTVSL
jgi:hypothetical protein